MSLALTLVALAVLVATSAFFSMSEIAVFSLEEHRFAGLADRPGGVTLSELREDPHRLLVTILVSNNFVNVAIASITTGVVIRELPAGTAVPVATLLAGTVVLVFGEIVPKSYGVGNAERVALRIARPLALLQRAMLPVVWLFERVTSVITAVVGGGSDIERPYVTREEIVALVAAAEELGVIEGDEEELIRRVFRFNTTAVGSVMVPRTDIVAVDAGATVTEAIDACSDARVTRLVVYEGSLDRPLGYVDVRDLVGAGEETPLEELTLPAVRAFEGREIDGILAELQASRSELVIVYDEFGAVEGLVTTEDIVEQLVGEIFDVGEIEPVTVRSRTTATALGEASTVAINDALGTRLPEDGETVAGLLTEALGRPADPGDTVEIADARLTVQLVESNRIRRIGIERLGETEP